MPYGLYPPMPRSPITYLSDGIDASVTTIPVDDVSKLPVAPNIATIGDGADSETIKYTGKTDSSLTGVTRGFEGEARTWNSGVPIANVPCAQHFRALQVNVVPYGCILMWSGATVSYTHLDVYKRQVPRLSFLILTISSSSVVCSLTVKMIWASSMSNGLLSV